MLICWLGKTLKIIHWSLQTWIYLRKTTKSHKLLLNIWNSSPNAQSCFPWKVSDIEQEINSLSKQITNHMLHFLQAFPW